LPSIKIRCKELIGLKDGLWYKKDTKEIGKDKKEISRDKKDG
jgi:hypothetical protein